MNRRATAGTALALVASLAIAGSAVAAPFDNGSFEAGPSVGTFVQVNAGSTAITGWTVDEAVDYIGSYWQAPEGDRSIDMNASPSMGVIHQAFDTVVNNTYVVQFLLSGNPMCGAGDKSLTVQATGGTLDTFTHTITAGYDVSKMEWDEVAYTFRATGSSSTLVFSSISGTNCGPALDNVRVTETVATGATCKNDGWESMLDDLGNPFKNQGDCVSYYATDGSNKAASSVDNHGALVSPAAHTDADALGAFPNRGAFVSCVARMKSDTTLKPLTLTEYLSTGMTLLDLPSVAALACGYVDTTPTDEATPDAAKAKGQDKAETGKAKGQAKAAAAKAKHQDKAETGKAKGQAKAVAAKAKHQH